MRNPFLLCIFLVCIFTSCSKQKDNYASMEILNEQPDTTAVLKLSGSFSSGPWGTVTGSAAIYQQAGKFQAKLSGFNSSNGPALHIYLSKEAMPVNYVDLGMLKSTTGEQLYNISGMPDFAVYKYISVHCVAYNHLFGYALLSK